ncbi:hypothetical protein N9355_07340 [Crocinitomicaceae bacterium]|nr:hypothetical protein [Crocinitomicaceae bacterium]
MDRSSFVSIVVSSLEKTLFEGDFGKPQNFVIIEVGDYYLQIASSRGAHKVHCEAVSNEFLVEGDQLSEDQKNSILKLGFKDLLSEENYSIEMPCDSHENRVKIGVLFYRTAEIYGSTSITDCRVHIG